MTSDTTFDATLLLLNDIPTGTTLTVTVRTIVQNGSIQTSNPEDYTVSY